MNVCMSEFMYVCMHVCMYVCMCMHECMYACNVCMYVWHRTKGPSDLVPMANGIWHMI